MIPNRRLSQSGNLLLESTPDHLERYEGNSPPALWFVASSRRVVVLSREVVVSENLCKLSVPWYCHSLEYKSSWRTRVYTVLFILNSARRGTDERQLLAQPSAVLVFGGRTYVKPLFTKLVRVLSTANGRSVRCFPSHASSGVSREF